MCATHKQSVHLDCVTYPISHSICSVHFPIGPLPIGELVRVVS